MYMILEYDKYIELVKEGLICTHNIQKYWTNLDIQLNSIGIKSDINILSKFIYDIDILNLQDLSDDLLEHMIILNQNLLGYYPSYIWVTNKIGTNGFPFDIKYLSNNYIKIKIRFESKYEDYLSKNDLKVPDFAYHLSPLKKKKKILKNGLCPKSYNRIGYHPERIYLFYDINDYKYLLNNLKFNDKFNAINNKYILYKVKLSDKNIIHTDPNFDKGFYTNDNISPLNIEIMENY